MDMTNGICTHTHAREKKGKIKILFEENLKIFFLKKTFFKKKL